MVSPSSTQSYGRVRRSAAAALLACAAVSAALVVAEAALRLEHFQFRAIPEVQFGWPTPQVLRDRLASDPDLWWVTPDYQSKLELARAMDAAVIFLGDSCVEWSEYPAIALQQVTQTVPALSTAQKLGVPGWSSEQGRWQMARDVTTLHPRVITVQFGWNDHWDALGPPDQETHPIASIVWAADHLRVYQAYRKALLGLEMRLQPDPPRRVSLERYRKNLRTIVEEGTRQGARMVLITAPTDHEPGHEPEGLRSRFLRDLHRLVPLHQEYVQATRDVSWETGASLCDLAKMMADLGPARERYFNPDGIHFNEAGDRYVGGAVARCIVDAWIGRTSASS